VYTDRRVLLSLNGQWLPPGASFLAWATSAFRGNRHLSRVGDKENIGTCQYIYVYVLLFCPGQYLYS
jgi:hypothetical protein